MLLELRGQEIEQELVLGRIFDLARGRHVEEPRVAAHLPELEQRVQDIDGGARKPALADGLAQVDAAEEKVTGNSATLQMGDPNAPGGGALKVTRVGTEWRVPMAELAKGRDPKEVEANLEQAQIQKDVVEDIATELSAGKFKSADEAMEAWKAKMMQAAMQKPQPAATQQAPNAPAPRSKPKTSRTTRAAWSFGCATARSIFWTRAT